MPSNVEAWLAVISYLAKRIKSEIDLKILQCTAALSQESISNRAGGSYRARQRGVIEGVNLSSSQAIQNK